MKTAFNWKRLSLIGALALGNHQQVRLFLKVQPKTITSETVVQFLQSLRRHVKGSVVLLWDGLQTHRSGETREYLEANQSWLTTERFPAYAPELNPVEYLWNHLSATDLANYCADDLTALARQIRKGARRVRRRQDLGWAFLKHSRLFD